MLGRAIPDCNRSKMPFPFKRGRADDKQPSLGFFD